MPHVLDAGTSLAETVEVEEVKAHLEGLPLRDEVLAAVGASLYLAASPDSFDGLSDAEFRLFQGSVSDFFSVLEKGGRVGVPENMRLPEGFANHFKNEVVPGLEIIRNDPAMRDAFRAEIKEILSHRNQVRELYRDGGKTYSDIIQRISGYPNVSLAPRFPSTETVGVGRRMP